MKNKWKTRIKRVTCFSLAFALTATGIFTGNTTSHAAVSVPDSLGTPEEIGDFHLETAGGTTEIGVSFYWDDELICYAFDAYYATKDGDTSKPKKYTSYSASYYGTLYDGQQMYLSPSMSSTYENFEPNNQPISIYCEWENQGERLNTDMWWTLDRFKVDTDMIREGRTDDYSYVVEEKQYGDTNYKVYQIASLPVGNFGTKSIPDTVFEADSLTHPGTERSFFEDTIVVQAYRSTLASYIYHIYSAVELTDENEDAPVLVDAMGGTVTESGKAYHTENDNEYVITKLPTASSDIEGFETEFVSWYYYTDDGTKVSISDSDIGTTGVRVPEGTVLCAEWDPPILYDVTYVDVLNSEDSLVLGTTTEAKKINSLVSGADLGSNTGVGVYYKDCVYTGCTTATVTTDGATVYRYFNLVNYDDEEEDADDIGKSYFKLTVETEDGDVLDTLKLYGNSGQTLSDVLYSYYENYLYGEDIKYFYSGYEVINTEDLEEAVLGEGKTNVTLTVRERQCTFTIVLSDDDLANQMDPMVADYQGKITLPETLPDGGKIDRYIDSMGRTYEPGEEIVAEHNLTLYVQHAICLYNEKAGEDKEDPVTEYVTRGEDFVLPEREAIGYELVNWADKYNVNVGAAGDVMENVKVGCDLYAVWSEPLTYQITYDMQDTGVVLLDNDVTSYQYTVGVDLPAADALSIPEGYAFDGWVDIDDEEKTLKSRISEEEYGDKVLTPVLSQEAQEENPAENPTENSAQKAEENSLSMDDSAESSAKSASDADDDFCVGSTFWKGNLQYKVLTLNEDLGTGTVRIIGNKCAKKKVTVKKSFNYNDTEFTVTQVGKKAFAKTKATKVVLPNSVKVIKKKAFANAKNLKQVRIGTGTKKIGKKAFYHDSKLKTVTIKSKKLSTVGKNAFKGVNKNAVIKVKAGKVKSYEKKLNASGLKEGVTVRKI